MVAERESLIDALRLEVEGLRVDVTQTRSQAAHMEDQLRLRINDLESTIAELVCLLFFKEVIFVVHSVKDFRPFKQEHQEISLDLGQMILNDTNPGDLFQWLKTAHAIHRTVN